MQDKHYRAGIILFILLTILVKSFFFTMSVVYILMLAYSKYVETLDGDTNGNE